MNVMSQINIVHVKLYFETIKLATSDVPSSTSIGTARVSIATNTKTFNYQVSLTKIISIKSSRTNKINGSSIERERLEVLAKQQLLQKDQIQIKAKQQLLEGQIQLQMRKLLSTVGIK